MTHQDAVALIAVSLEAVTHRRLCVPDQALTYMPRGLLRLALEQLDEDGADTSAVRVQLLEGGLDLSEIPRCADASEPRASDKDESTGESSGSRVPTVIAEAILTKFHEGWSKSRIAREFRLNRRTIIRICARR
jgi:hypothetical protein